MNFHTRLKECRQAKGLTQKQMAELIETTERAYQYYESGTRNPNLYTLVRISRILKVSTDYLLDNDTPI